MHPNITLPIFLIKLSKIFSNLIKFCLTFGLYLVYKYNYGLNLGVYFKRDTKTWVVEIPGLFRIEEPTLNIALRWAAENAKVKIEEPQGQYKK